jgi:hypothetical protein
MKERKDRRDLSEVIARIQQSENGMTTVECAGIIGVSVQRACDLLARHRDKVVQLGNNRAARWYGAEFFEKWSEFKLSTRSRRNIDDAHEFLAICLDGAHISSIANILKVSNDRASDLMRRDDRFILLGCGRSARWCVAETLESARKYQEMRKKAVIDRRAARRREIRKTARALLGKPEPTIKVGLPLEWPRPVNSVWELARAA